MGQAAAGRETAAACVVSARCQAWVLWLRQALHQCHRHYRPVCLPAVPWLCCSVNPSGGASRKVVFHPQAVTELPVSPHYFGVGGVGGVGKDVKKGLESIHKCISAVGMLHMYTSEVPRERLMKKLEHYRVGQLLNRFPH